MAEPNTLARKAVPMVWLVRLPTLLMRFSKALAITASMPTFSSRPPNPKPKMMTATEPSMDSMPPRPRMLSMKSTPEVMANGL